MAVANQLGIEVLQCEGGVAVSGAPGERTLPVESRTRGPFDEKFRRYRWGIWAISLFVQVRCGDRPHGQDRFHTNRNLIREWDAARLLRVHRFFTVKVEVP